MADVEGDVCVGIHRSGVVETCQRLSADHTAEIGFFDTPFSIKKNANIYGIIFGSGNLLGLGKFLKVCWNMDRISGEANYDIDDDILGDEISLFPEMNVSKKRDVF